MQCLIFSIHSLTLVTRSLIFSIHQELQLNILQQSQLLQAGETAKTSGQLHQLQNKQQQLVAQLQVGLVIVVVDVGVFVGVVVVVFVVVVVIVVVLLLCCCCFVVVLLLFFC